MFYYGELSNFFTYTTYHFIKTENEHMAYVSTLFQCLWFTIFRVFVYSYFLLNYLVFSSIDSIFMKFFCTVIYVMGLMWGYNLLNTTYDSIEKRGHLELVVKEMYNVKSYLRSTFYEVVHLVNMLVKNKGNASETTPETTQETTQETTNPVETDNVGTVTIDPLEDTRNYTLRRRPTEVIN